MLRLERLRAVLGDELLLPDVGDADSLADFVNEALSLWAQHPWRYLSNKRAEIAFRDGADSVELPESCVTVTEVFEKDSPYRSVRIADRREYARQQRVPSRTWVCAIEDRPSLVPERQGELAQFLLLPTLNRLTSPLVVIYQAAPLRVADATDTIDVPVRFEACFKGLLRAMARGRYDEDAGSVEEEVARFMVSPLWQAAVNQDGAQVLLEAPRMGAVGDELGRSGDPYDDERDPDYYPR